MITSVLCSPCCLSDYFERHWNCTVVVQSGQRSLRFCDNDCYIVLHHKLHDALQLFVINNAEVWHATRPNKPARFTSLQVVQIQVMEGRDSGRRRP